MRAPWRATALILSGALAVAAGPAAVDWICSLPWPAYLAALTLILATAIWWAIPTMEDD